MKERIGLEKLFEDVEVHTVIGRSGGMSEIGGIPENENAEGLPEDKSVGGLPEDESAGGLPEVENGGGLPEEVKKTGYLLAEFKERICDCIGLVCKMENRDRIAVCIY